MTPQQQAAIEAGNFVTRLNNAVLFPLIALLSGIAFLYFLWGAAQYIINADNESARAEGKKHITFGLVGLVVMFSAFAILSLAVNTFGLGKTLNCADNPTQSGCDTVFKLSP